MALNPTVPPAIAVAGFLVLIFGSMGYMGVFTMVDILCYILMVIGLLMTVAGMALMMYLPVDKYPRGGTEMGFIEKLKNAFKKKNKGEAAAAPAEKASKGAAPAAKRSAEFKAEGKVGDALRFAADKIDAKVEAGMDVKKADLFMGALKGIEADGADEDAKLIAISQVIGGIVNG